MSVDWKLKIKAFLYQLPWGALCEQEPNDRNRQIIKDLVDDENLTEARQANEIAFSLDVPPFVRQQKWIDWLEDPELTHPLSGASYSLAKYLPENQRKGLCNGAKQAVEEALQQVKGYLGNSPTNDNYKKAFLVLWRLLPDLIREKEQENQSGPKLGPLWELLPADPRVPDHSIWDHASLASAIAGTWDENEKGYKPAFLIFTIASVQDFVSTARRTQDFWMSSYLLSYLTWVAMKGVAEKYGPDSIITPGLRAQPLVDLWLKQLGIQDSHLKSPLADELMIASFPNIFMALVPESEATNIAREAEKAIKDERDRIFNKVKSHIEEALEAFKKADKFGEIVQAAVSEGIKGPNRRQYAQKVEEHFLQTLPKLASDKAWEQIWARQRKDFLTAEIFWITYPWQPTSNGPAKVIETYETLLQPKPLDDKEAAAFAHFQPLFEYVQQHNTVNIGMVYPLLSALAGRCLTARKNLRSFQQSESNGKIGEPEHKCSLCGIREALHPCWVSGDPRDHYTELRIFWEVLSQVESSEIKLRGRIRRGERLCAVCLTKRLALEAYFIGEFNGAGVEIDYHIFPSTASMATAKFKENLLNQLGQSEPLREALKKYADTMSNFLQNYGLFYFSAIIPKLKRRAQVALEQQDLRNDAQMEQILLGDKGFLRLDGEWLYEESFDKEKIKREYGVEVDEENLRKAREALRALLDALKELNKRLESSQRIRLPAKYYAVLYMDGDSIGEWVSGRKGPLLKELLHPQVRDAIANGSDDELKKLLGLQVTGTGEVRRPVRRPLGPALHSSFSNTQRNFARKIVRLVVEERYCGKLIYAGGDDVLAFVPTDDLLGVLRELRLLFTGDEFSDDKQGTKIKSGKGFIMLEKNGQKELLMMMGSVPMGNLEAEQKRASASTGVVIAHHSHPFSHVIEEAKRAMKEDAKKKFGKAKDAFAVHLLKRSGEPLEVRAQWFTKNLGDLPQILKEAAQCIFRGDAVIQAGLRHERRGYRA